MRYMIMSRPITFTASINLKLQYFIETETKEGKKL